MGSRRAIHIEGVAHGPGRPSGSKIGNIVVSAALSGRSIETGEVPEDPAEQIEELFKTMVRFLEAADATIEDVIRVDVFLTEPSYRDLLNVVWLKYFNDEESLPVRKATFGPLPGTVIAQMELMAVTD